MNRVQFYYDEAKLKLEMAQKKDEKARKAAKEAAEGLSLAKRDHQKVKNRFIFLAGDSIQETLRKT